MASRYLLLISIVLGLCNPTWALDAERALSQYQQRSIGVEQGLMQVSVTALTQDPRGFIWIGGQNGIARFDGIDFATYNSRNGSGLLSDVIIDLQWYRGTLWVLTLRSLQKLTPEGFQQVIAEPIGELTPTSFLFHEDAQYICTLRGLFRFADNKLTATGLTDSCYTIKQQASGLIVGGKGKVYYVRQQQVLEQPFPATHQLAEVKDLVLDRGVLYVATNLGLLKFDGRSFKTISLPSSRQSQPVNRLYIDDNKLLWVATNQSLYRLYKDQIYPLDTPPELNNVTQFMSSRDGSLWLGTRDRGIIQLKNSWAARFDHRQGLTNNLVWSVAVSKQSGLLAGTADGLFRLKAHRFVPLLSGDQLISPEIYTLYVDKDNVTWLGTRQGVIQLSADGKIVNDKRLNQLVDKNIHAITRDHKSRLLFLTNKGLYFLQGDQLESPVNQTADTITSFRAVTIFQDKLLLASQRGVYTLDGDDKLSVYTPLPQEQFYTAATNINGRVFVGSYSDGLYIFDKGSWHHLSREQGLVFNNVFSFILFKEFLYVSGFDGVYRIAIGDLERFLNGEIDKVHTDAVLNDKGFISGSQQAFCCNGAGHARVARFADSLWYPTRLGVLKLEPHKINRPAFNGKPQIIGIEYGKQTRDLYFMPNHLTINDRDIHILFSAVSTFDKRELDYRFRLYDSNTLYKPDWSKPQPRRIASFTNLSAGNYLFEVQVSNGKGNWSESTLLQFSIPPYWYETFWAKALVLFILALLIYVTVLLFVRRQKRKEIELEALIEERTKALIETNIKLEKAIQQLQYYSFTDSLTGTHNRHYLEKQIDSDIAHYLRQKENKKNIKFLWFLLLDVDHFKRINDQYGHPTGDEVLRQTAAVLRTAIRDGDYLVRWGGEEFLIVLRPEQGISIDVICSRLLNKFRRTHFVGLKQEAIKISVSIGFSQYPLQASFVSAVSWQDAIALADHALYLSKNHGRDQWHGYEFNWENLDNVDDHHLPELIEHKDPKILTLKKGAS